MKLAGGLLPVVLVLTACGGETVIQDRYSMEYLDAKPGKPLVYPVGVDKPEQSSEYDIPKLPAKPAAREYQVNEVVKPPRIVPLPKEDDEKG